ncbi:MAG: hypothetical protein ACPLKX_02915 [Dictyoglomaceae bacterium]
MDLNSLFKDPKLKLIVAIIGGLILFGGVGYYYYANFLTLPPKIEVGRSKVSTVPSFTDTITQVLSTLTYKETVYTYPNIALGRDNPFVPVIPFPEVGSTSKQEIIKEQPKKEIPSTPIKVISQEKSFASDFRLTGVIKVGNVFYAILEEGDRGYIVKHGQKIKENIYVSSIDEKSITLKKGKEIAILKLGGE